MQNLSLLIENVIKKMNKFIDYAGLLIIGSLSLGYALFYNNIAKLHVSLSFIKAPFFIGDMVFVIYFLLFFIKWLINPKKINIFSYLFLFYVGFVIVKIFLGYFYWGSLSLRHAVLFCYPLFAVFSSSFYRIDFFEPRKNLVPIFMIIFIFAFSVFYRHFVLSCFILALVLINVYPKRSVRYILYSFLLLSFPYEFVFVNSRTFIISNLLAIIYTSFGFLYVSKVKIKYKLIFLLLFISFIYYGITKISNQNEIRSLTGVVELVERYDKEMGRLSIEERAFVEPKLPVKLYNEKNIWVKKFVENRIGKNIESLYVNVKKRPSSSVTSVVKNRNDQFKLPNQLSDNNKEKIVLNTTTLVKETGKVNHSVSGVRGPDTLIEEPGKVNQIASRDRGPYTPYGNSLFRIFIWKDVFEQIISKRPIFGFDFGKPFRSRSLEILDYAPSEWSRDGWICIHNSYIDIVYRAGVIGILMIVFILFMLFSVAINSFRNRSLTGILLTGILINWFMAANFLEILEMPYTAIPLWSLFGLTFTYLFKGKTVRKNIKETSAK